MLIRTIERSSRRTAHIDAGGLEAGLRRHLRGDVRFDAGSRALYAA